MIILGLFPFFQESRRLRRVFEGIYSARAWGDCESVSGPGSTRERASAFLPDLISLVKRLGVETLLDAPCGDFNWAAPLADSVKRYIGIDIVPALIAATQRRWPSPNREFRCLDMVHEPLPAADLVVCRDGLVHLTNADARRALANFLQTGARYLVLTTFVGGHRSNPDIRNGQWRPLNLQLPPFSFPPPVELIDERCYHTGGIYSDKRLGLWRAEDLPGGQDSI